MNSLEIIKPKIFKYATVLRKTTDASHMFFTSKSSYDQSIDSDTSSEEKNKTPSPSPRKISLV